MGKRVFAEVNSRRSPLSGVVNAAAGALTREWLEMGMNKRVWWQSRW